MGLTNLPKDSEGFLSTSIVVLDIRMSNLDKRMSNLDKRMSSLDIRMSKLILEFGVNKTAKN